MAYSELVFQSGSKMKTVATIKVILPIISGLILASFSLTFYIWRRKNLGRTREGRLHSYNEKDYANYSHREDLELPLVPMSTLVKATKSFSSDNKLGEGGFGPVYKGVMEDGQEIAVKRLSKTSSQGIDEFKNEVICISTLQHRNLVKLRGCCIKGDEKMLIYEFMPNKSLDLFIFDELKSMLLDWPKRFHIIKGIARGLLYLHQDSRLRSIHGDLKTSNILLDYEMNPKISDFGLARSFGGDEMGASTSSGRHLVSAQRISICTIILLQWLYVTGVRCGWAFLSQVGCLQLWRYSHGNCEWEEKQRIFSSRPPPQSSWTCMETIQRRQTPRADRCTFWRTEL